MNQDIKFDSLDILGILKRINGSDHENEAHEVQNVKT